MVPVVRNVHAGDRRFRRGGVQLVHWPSDAGFGFRPATHRRATRARRGAEDDGFAVAGPVPSGRAYFFFGFPLAAMLSTERRCVAWAASCSSSV
jgi:hypothetical protein